MSHVAGDFTGLIRDRLSELDGETLAGDAPTIADSTAETVADLVTDFNALLAALRTRGVLAADE